MRIACFSILVVAACGEAPPPSSSIQVVDVWGDPITEAMVLVDGMPSQFITDDRGRARLPISEPGSYTIRAGHPDYIQSTAELEVAGINGKLPAFELYPRPDSEQGFFILGDHSYLQIPEVPIKAIGTELKMLYGLPQVGDARTSLEDIEIVFHSEHRSLDELRRLELHLYKLKYEHSLEFDSAMKKEAKVKMYVPDGQVELEPIERFESRKDFLFKPKEKLEEGAYAFAAELLLNMEQLDEDRFDKLPKELRVAYPFRVE